jgi:hypothetical protein
VRGREGVVFRVDGTAPVPEAEAHRRERLPDHTYGVRFDLRELFGVGADANAAVHVDLYERYLDATEPR